MVSDFEKERPEDLEDPGQDAGNEKELQELAEITEAAEEELAALPDDAVINDGDAGPAEMRVSHGEEGSAQGVMVKYCLFCRETILADAIACKYCGHVVHVFEGGVFKQLWWFFWAGVIAFVGSLLPYYGGEDVGKVLAFETFPGAIYMIFSIFLIFAMFINIYAKRLIMGPVILMFIPAIHSWWSVVGAVGEITGDEIVWSDFLYKIKAINALTDHVGSGQMLILIGSTIATLTFIMSLFTAIAGAGKGGDTAKAGGRRRGRGK